MASPHVAGAAAYLGESLGHAGPGSRRARRRGDVKRDQVRRRRDAESAALQRGDARPAPAPRLPGQCTAVGRLGRLARSIGSQWSGFTQSGPGIGSASTGILTLGSNAMGSAIATVHHNQQLLTRRGWCRSSDVQGCQLTEPAGSPRDPVQSKWQWLRDLHGSGLPDVWPRSRWGTARRILDNRRHAGVRQFGCLGRATSSRARPMA